MDTHASAGERDGLERIERSHSVPHGLVRREQIVQASADGAANTSIARRLGVTNLPVCHWRMKWFEREIAWLYMARPGWAAGNPL